MKKSLFCTLLSLFLLTWCWNNTTIEEKTIDTEVDTWNEIIQEVDDNQTLEDAIINYIADNYSCDDWFKLFVNSGIKAFSKIEYIVISSGFLSKIYGLSCLSIISILGVAKTYTAIVIIIPVIELRLKKILWFILILLAVIKV